jgi:hypothetical protein
MSWVALLAGLLLSWLQVPRPAPSSSTDVARELESGRRAIMARESNELGSLAAELEKGKEISAARLVWEKRLQPVTPDGPTHIMPLPEVVPSQTPDEALPSRSGAANTPGSAPSDGPEAWRKRLNAIQSRAASDLFQLAERAAHTDPPRFAFASVCLRAALEREPDHREARRLLGYVPHEGGWARPFAVRQLRAGFESHPVFGWVPGDWIAHLDQGELPAPTPPGQKNVRWLPADEADQLRAGWDPPWRISTEHFEIQTDVTLAEAISFGRRLEAFHDLFTTLFADILGETLPLVRRFRDPKLVGEPEYKRHVVYYFASRQEYVNYFRSKPDGPDLARSLGYYNPPKSSSGRAPAYFFRDPGGQLPVTANLYHEVSHQLLFETAGSNAYTRNAGNYWVFEGLGTYFETVTQQPDGSLEVGGLVGRRMEEAIKSLVRERRSMPLATFVTLRKSDFERDDPRVYLYYQQAMALATFLMQSHGGQYRDAFLDYVRDAYRGRIKERTGRSLQDRLGEPYSRLDVALLEFLKPGLARDVGPARTKSPRASSAIRTVPRPD